MVALARVRFDNFEIKIANFWSLSNSSNKKGWIPNLFHTFESICPDLIKDSIFTKHILNLFGMFACNIFIVAIINSVF